MKGLIIKDLKIVLRNSKFILIMLAISIIIYSQTSAEDGSFMVGYIIMIFWLLSINTFSFDEADKSIVFLMTLPSGRKVYVTEKYILSFALCAIGCMLSMLFPIIAGNQPITDVLLQSVSVLAVYIMFSIIIIPLMLKMGREKSGVIMLVFGVLAFTVFGAFKDIIGRISTLNVIPVSAAKNFIIRAVHAFLSLDKPLICIILCLAFIICVALSWLTSIRIMRKKEF